jgi:ribose transport system substrate-binding protein
VVSADPEAYGHDCAMAIGGQIGGKGTVAITQANYNATENLLADSFTRAMHENFPNVKVMTPQLEGLDSVQAVAKASAILEANPEIVAALSTTGNLPPTWPGAGKQTGHQVISIAMNYTRLNLDAIRDGHMYAAVAQPLWEESYECAKLLDRASKGEKLPWWTKMPAPLITKENVDQYYRLMDKIDAAMK